MLRSKSFWTFAVVLVLVGAACYAVAGPGGEKDDDDDAVAVDVALDQLPANVKAAAVAAVPGLVITESERETQKDGTVVYDVEGTANGKAYEIEVTAGGKVLEVESEDAHDDKSGDDDDDDGDDDGDGD